MSKGDAWEDVVLDESFVAGAGHREGSAAEREAWARSARQALRKTQRRSARDQRRQRRRDRISRHTTALALVGLLLAALAWSQFFGGGETGSQAAPTPSKARVVYALPADATLDDAVIPAVRHELDIVQRWFESQTDGRRIRLVAEGGVTDVEIYHLSLTAAELRDRPDAATLVDDELRPKTDSTSTVSSDEILLSFIPVTFPEQVRCGEGSESGFAIVWIGSCNNTPSGNSANFGDGATETIAHELVHALGAVERCAPHYGRNGHVTDDPRDLLYDGPAPSPGGASLLLDPGHDDYFRTGSRDCPDIAAHRAWTK